MFELYASLYEGYRLRELYCVEGKGSWVSAQMLLRLVERHLPNLHAHFVMVEYSLDLLALGWFQTLLFEAPMPPAARAAVFDWWIATGEMEVLFRAALAMLQLYLPALVRCDFEGIQAFWRSPEPVLGGAALLRAARALPLEEGVLIGFEQQVRTRENAAVPLSRMLMAGGPFADAAFGAASLSPLP